MKLLLITSVLFFVAALAAPADKQKREILPGDPRYGTDYHHHHHHHHDNENEVQISKAAGNYVGSYIAPEEARDDSSSQAQPSTAYGPPNYNPGKPIGVDASSDATVLQVPSTSYGVPDTQINNNYVESAEAKLASAVTQTNLNIDYQAPSLDAPITSYAQKKETQIAYTNSEKTSYEQPQVETNSTPEIQPEVQPKIQKVSSSVPLVKIAKEYQGSISSVPSYTSFPSYNFYSSYPSYSNIPVRTVDHHVNVHVPQPYPVPVTKHVAYPVPVPHAVQVPKPYYVRVAQPVPVTVNRPYAVEVPRAVPYPVPQYVRTNVPVIQPHYVSTLDTTKASNPIEGFIENAQSTFQNVFGNLPSFQNPLEGFQNPFQNFELPSIFPSLPSLTPQNPAAPVAVSNGPAITNVPSASSADSIAIENPALKIETNSAAAAVTHQAKHQASQSTEYKPVTTCAGCSVSSSSTHIVSKQKELGQSADANGGYNY